jgi:putative CocE/NonD family hydrolase
MQRLYGIGRTLLLALLAVPAACGEGQAPAAGARSSSEPLVMHDVAVPMRDGTILRADVFRPEGEGPFPVLVYRTPYDKRGAAESYDTHVEAVTRGYAVVLQDVRGRYASDGLFEPYRNEGRDGFDTIEWAAAQPWSNGIVGTFGLSYPGAVQWLAALEQPPHLEAMVPAMTYSSPRNFFYMNGVFDLSWLPWLYLNIAPDARQRLDLPGIRTSEAAAESWRRVADEYRSWLPLAALPYLRDVAPYYYEWLEHPPEDPWWDWAEVRGRYERVDAAVLHLSGWHDDAYGPEGAVTNFGGLVAARRAEADGRTHLLLGPWKHGVGATMSRQTGDLDFGAQSVIDYDDELLDFFDHYLKGVDNRFGRGEPVRYFVMGENRWFDAARWPPPDAQAATLFFAGGDERVLAASLPADAPASSSFVADPANPVTDPVDAAGPHDYRALIERDDLLTFDSAPFSEPTRVAGAMRAVVFASCDCRDFDLWARVYDVHPDGRVMNLMTPGQDLIRASYREPGSGRQLPEPGRIYELRLPNLLTANLFAPGHRLRVQVSATFAPHFSRNLQTGESEVTASASQPATIRIHHDARYASRIELPIVAQ